MTDRVKELEAQLLAKDKQLQEALEALEHIQKREAENIEVIGDLIAGLVHDINNLNTRVRSSSHTISHAFSDLRQYLPTLFFQIPPEHQKEFFALVDRAEQSQRQHPQRLSSREERQFRRELIKELETYELDNVDEIADILVDIGVYKDIGPFIPLLKGEHYEDVLQTAYSLISLQEANQWSLIPAYHRIVKVTHILRYSIVALLANCPSKDKITNGIENVLSLYRNLLEQQQIEVIKQYEDIPTISCYPGLDLVWMNLIENAIEAIEDHGTLKITVGSGQSAVAGIRHPASNDQYIFVEITDSGCGIPEEIQGKVFDRSVTTKSRGTAHGVGLYLVHKIIDKHQGKIEVESRPGQTTFRILLPDR